MVLNTQSQAPTRQKRHRVQNLSNNDMNNQDGRYKKAKMKAESGRGRTADVSCITSKWKDTGKMKTTRNKDKTEKCYYKSVTKKDLRRIAKPLKQAERLRLMRWGCKSEEGNQEKKTRNRGEEKKRPKIKKREKSTAQSNKRAKQVLTEALLSSSICQCHFWNKAQPATWRLHPACGYWRYSVKK